MSFCFRGFNGEIHHHTATCECDQVRISYRFPLRSDLDVRFQLPMDMTMSESRRLADFILALTTPDSEPEE